MQSYDDNEKVANRWKERPRLDTLVNMYKIPQGSFVNLRFLNFVVPFTRHWMETKTGKSFPWNCYDYNPQHDDYRGQQQEVIDPVTGQPTGESRYVKSCPAERYFELCKSLNIPPKKASKMRFGKLDDALRRQKRLYMFAINRDWQTGPRGIPNDLPFPNSPFCVVEVPPTFRDKIASVTQVRGGVSPLSHSQGCDLSVRYDPRGTVGNKWSVQPAMQMPTMPNYNPQAALTAEELGWLATYNEYGYHLDERGQPDQSRPCLWDLPALMLKTQETPKEMSRSLGIHGYWSHCGYDDNPDYGGKPISQGAGSAGAVPPAAASAMPPVVAPPPQTMPPVVAAPPPQTMPPVVAPPPVAAQVAPPPVMQPPPAAPPPAPAVAAPPPMMQPPATAPAPAPAVQAQAVGGEANPPVAPVTEGNSCPDLSLSGGENFFGNFFQHPNQASACSVCKLQGVCISASSS